MGRTILIILINACYLVFLQGQIQLPSLISDGMILQRNTTVNVWGWTNPQEQVRVAIEGEVYEAKSDKNGKFLVKIPAHEAGGPYKMEISSKDNNTVINDIYFGDLWLCSGQSNMELSMSRVAWKYPEIIENPDAEFIRQFKVI